MAHAFDLYLQGLVNKNLTDVPLADNVVFDGIMDKTESRAAFLELCKGFFGMIGDIRVHRHYHNDTGGTVVYEFDSPAGVIPIVDVIDIKDGKIIKMRPYFDPTPLAKLQAQTG